MRGDDKDDPGYAAQDGGLTAYRPSLTAVIDRLYDPSWPFRPTDGLYLGKTPIAPFRIPMGSYLLIIACNDSGQRPAVSGEAQGQDALTAHRSQLTALTQYAPVRVPVHIGRLAYEEAVVTLYRDGEIPYGFIQIPAGKFIYQGDKENTYSGPAEIKETDDFLIAKFPVTCLEYLEFLNDLAACNPAEAARRVPRESEKAGYYWPKGQDGKYVIPSSGWLAEAPDGLKGQARKLAGTPAEWEGEWPVFGVSWEDSMAYAAWFSMKHGLQASLGHEVMWEKAARGVDARLFPFGRYFDNTFANTMGSHDGLVKPCRVDSFPVDESPCGARGLCGNSADWCINDIEDGQRRLLRGGCWFDAGISIRSPARIASPPVYVSRRSGFRLFARVSGRTS